MRASSLVNAARFPSVDPASMPSGRSARIELHDLPHAVGPLQHLQLCLEIAPFRLQEDLDALVTSIDVVAQEDVLDIGGPPTHSKGGR